MLSFFPAAIPMLAALTALVSPPAPGDGVSMNTFFEALENEWRYTGEGMHRRLGADGLFAETEFDIETNVTGDTFKPQWDLSMRFAYSTGASVQEITRFAVRGDRLFMGTTAAQEPVTVLAAEPTRLEYRFTRAYQGYLYTYTHRLALAEDGTLSVFSSLEVNGGVVIEEQEWVAR